MAALDYTGATGFTCAYGSTPENALVDDLTASGGIDYKEKWYWGVELADDSQTADGVNITQHAASYLGFYTVQCSSDGFIWTDLGTYTGDTNDHSFAFTAAKAKYFRLVADNDGGNWLLYFAEFTDSGAPAVETPNTAYVQVDQTVGTATASREWGGNIAEHGNDGSYNTNWASQGTTPVGTWWKIDFGTATALSGGRTSQHYISRMGEWELQYSDDDSNWTVAATLADADGYGITEQTWDTVSARYWRYITLVAEGNVIVAEFEFWEDEGGGTLPAGQSVYEYGDALMLYLIGQGATSKEIVGALNELNGTSGVEFQLAYDTYFGLV